MRFFIGWILNNIGDWMEWMNEEINRMGSMEIGLDDCKIGYKCKVLSRVDGFLCRSV